MLHHHLEIAGATVESFSSGESLLTRLAAMRSMQFASPVEKSKSAAFTNGKAHTIESIDLILLDMQMPGLDGYETARRIRAAEYAIPIIALTASVLGGERRKCLNAGCSDYLAKPVRRHQLLSTLSSHLRPDQFAKVVIDKRADAVDGTNDNDGRARKSSVIEVECESAERCRILVIEDHTATRQAMVRLLTRNGYEATGAGTAEEGRTVVVSWVPNFILLDRSLPDTDGVSLAREFRSNPVLLDTRLICISGTALDTCLDDERVFDAFLLKPVELATLIKSISSLQSR